MQPRPPNRAGERDPPKASKPLRSRTFSLHSAHTATIQYGFSKQPLLAAAPISAARSAVNLGLHLSAVAMAESPEKVVVNVGNRLSQSRLNKDTLVKLLKQASNALSELKQSSSLQSTLGPLNKSLVQNNLLHHKDKDVRLLMAVCISEIIRVLAPSPPFSDQVFKDIFKLIIGTFADLADIASPYFSRRVKILETIDALRCCVLMLDIGCEGLVLEMFRVFFSNIREDHQENVFNAMLSIMTLIINEKVSPSFVETILQNLLKDEKGKFPASFKLAVSVIQNSAEKMEPLICGFLTSSILERDITGNELKEFYHEIIFELFQCAPQILNSVIPNLTQELITDQVDIRIKAVHLAGKLFAQSKLRCAQEYRSLFIEFIKRFSDKSAEVRVCAVECAKACYMSNCSATGSLEILNALNGRLLDFDDKVRTQAVTVMCELAISALSSFPSKLVLQVTERLRDKKVSVRRKTMQKLLELYRAYCDKCSKGLISCNDDFEQIPSRIIMLSFDKDCKEFRPQNMELMIMQNLFPDFLSIEERANHWIAFFSFFSVSHKRVLSSILSQKKRLQMEMKIYADLREKEKENFSEETEQKISDLFVKMSTSFLDSVKAEECFQKLHQMNDNKILKALLLLTNEEASFSCALSIQDSILSMIGDKHALYDFLRTLCLKCSNSIFTTEHVHCILKSLLDDKDNGSKCTRASAIDLLSIIVNAFPSHMRGSEDLFLRLFAKDASTYTEKLLQMLASVGHHICVKLSDVFPFLEPICLEGTRLQSKCAISAIASLTKVSDYPVISDLCKKLLASLHNGQNIPTALQSLGCIMQHLFLTCEALEGQISEFIYDKLFHPVRVQSSYEQTTHNRISVCSYPCKLKVYGLKTLVKSILAHPANHTRHRVGDFLNILSKTLKEEDAFDSMASSSSERDHLRLAAAKSILRLSTRWDSHIFPKLFYVTVMTARDLSHDVRRGFLNKTYALLKQYSIPSRYSCAFALASSDCQIDIQTDSEKYLADVIKIHSQKAQTCQYSSSSCEDGGTLMRRPEYVVVFLIHVLAHGQGFPQRDCDNEQDYTDFCWPLIVMLRAIFTLANDVKSSNNIGTASYLLGIFRAIKKAEDAVDANFTSKLHLLAHIGSLIVKHLACDFKSSSNALRMVLLPSSFYMVNHISKSDEMQGSSERFIDGSFVGKILRLKPISQGSCGAIVLQDAKMIITKEVDSEEQITSIAVKRKAIKDHFHCSNGNFTQKVTATRLQKKQFSSSSISVEVLTDSSQANEWTGGTPENIGPYQCQEQIMSSCGSAVTKPSSDFQVPNNKLEMVSCSPQVTQDEKNTTLNSSGPIYTERLKDNLSDEALVGQRINLWSPLDECFYSGTISAYDSKNSTHKVKYDNGTAELLHLHHEKWELISNISSITNDEGELDIKEWEKSSDTSLEDLTDLFATETSQNESTFLGSKKVTIAELKSSITGKGRSKRMKPSASARRKTRPIS